MKFALNYSPQAMDLLRADRITIDLWKCPAWPDMIDSLRPDYPLYVHFPLIAGQHNLESVGLDHVAALREATGTPFVNTHLGARYSDLDDLDDAEAAVETMLDDVTPLVHRFGRDNVILENAPYPDIFNDKPPLVSRPEVIREAVTRSGCGLLLDIAHARLTADALGMEVCDYIEQLPLDRLRELHVTGIGLNQTGDREDHLPMTDEDWALLDWAMCQIHSGAWACPTVVACEYGGIGPLFDWRSDPDVIAHDIPRMVALLHQNSH